MSKIPDHLRTEHDALLALQDEPDTSDIPEVTHMSHFVSFTDRHAIVSWRVTLDADIARLQAMRDEDIDFSDIPELTEEQFQRPCYRQHRFVALQEDVLSWFRNGGMLVNEQVVNDALRDYMRTHTPPPRAPR